MIYHHWQNDHVGQPPFTKASPNLQALLRYLIATFGGQGHGIYGVRPIRGGTAPSTHSYGAALDWRYRNVGAGRRNVADIEAVIGWLIANSEELGVQMIIDYEGGRIWKTGRGWKDRAEGKTPGNAWLHIETTPDNWADTRPIETRGSSTPHPMPPTTEQPPLADQHTIIVSMSTIRSNARGLDVRRAQALLVAHGAKVDIDGIAGTHTIGAIRTFQQIKGLTVDGWVGPQTWRALLDPDA
jgi:hypothetical protein